MVLQTIQTAIIMLVCILLQCLAMINMQTRFTEYRCVKYVRMRLFHIPILCRRIGLQMWNHDPAIVRMPEAFQQEQTIRTPVIGLWTVRESAAAAYSWKMGHWWYECETCVQRKQQHKMMWCGISQLHIVYIPGLLHCICCGKQPQREALTIFPGFFLASRWF
jgi:hypothetical protein